MSRPERGSITDVVASVLGLECSALDERIPLATYGVDSLSSLEILVRVEALASVSLDLREYHRAQTIADLEALVSEARRRDEIEV